MKYLGVDIGGTAVKLGIVDKTGEIISTYSKGVAFDAYETPIIETVKVAIDEFFEKEQVELADFLGIGVSATGQIDYRSGCVIGVGGNIKNWCHTNIKEELELKYGLKTTVLNDANCMIIGEKWLGRAKGYEHVIGITIGTGVGGGILVNGEILQGTTGIGGELGHFSIDSHGVKCRCGNIGCYENYASMTALVNKVLEGYDELDLPVSRDEVNGRVIFEALEAGNEKVADMVEEWILMIAKGLVSLVHLFNPEIIVIGGGVCTQEERFIKPIREYVLSHAMEQFKKELKVESAMLFNNAGLVGAVYYHIHHI
ncbi:ROK family protein [Turicibacter sanguinis]|uniref:ROK family protein n=2 Tax=Turicibacter sanguinis TaxID=154288 RepID=A0A9X5AN80_9FIRM|nr:ROK family protein [Turicibacter sanguinis]EFF63002.1 putative glucokinase [Turicibacter sanguinis PC909]MCU7191408.1 ROK family protein [Turicibacter sanguinis]MCU7212063.1 ROK family protein [Turicibacter sanguinis]MDB8459766.1 ROK family protein [Turicibacter sanguinis]MDB8542644.1 ROK family protein [Turicibacter sanguinis]